MATGQGLTDREFRAKFGGTGQAGEREFLSRGDLNVEIEGQKIFLGDAFRKAERTGTFMGLDPEARATAQARADLGLKAIGSQGTTFDPAGVDLSGDLEEVAKRTGVGQTQIVDIRRSQAPEGQVTAEGGLTDTGAQRTFELRQALGKTGALIARKNSFVGDGRSIRAPRGKIFELYEGGGVSLVNEEGAEIVEPTKRTSLFDESTADGKPISGFVEEQLKIEPAEGKTIKRTGQTIKNPQTGVDVQAKEGHILIEYTDGTVEERPITSINQPGEVTNIGEFGPTGEELGITRQTEIKGGAGTEVTREPITKTVAELQAAGASAEEIEARIAAEGGLAPTSNLTYIGTEGAGPGMARFRADDGTILERPASLQQFAKQPELEGAQPSIGAGGLSFTDDLQSALGSFGLDGSTNEILEQLRNRPVVGVEQMYTDLQNKMGVPTIKANVETIQQRQTAERQKFNDQVEKINLEPWLSEGMRSRKVKRAQEKYEANKAGLAAELALWTTLQDSARQEAQFITSTAVQQANADRAFDMSIVQLGFDRMDQKFNAQAKIASLQLQEAGLKQSADQFIQKMAVQREQFEVGAQIDIAKLEQGASEFEQKFGLDVAKFGLSQQKEARIGAGGGKLSANEQLPFIQDALFQTRGEDGFVDPNTYAQIRTQAKSSPTEFDSRFGHLVNPRDKERLGVSGFGKEGKPQFLSEDFFRRAFGEDELQKQAGGGFLGIGKGNVGEYLQETMRTVNVWRDAGMTDEQIFKEMQG